MPSNCIIINRLCGTINQKHVLKKVGWVAKGIVNTKRGYHYKAHFHKNQKQWFLLVAGAAVVGGSTLFVYNTDILKRAHASTVTQSIHSELHPPLRPDLPTYKLDEVKKHGKNAGQIWGVYDITEFVESHPGGDKILLAAGDSIEPFWALYAQHKTKEVVDILETLRIGNIDPEELAKASSKTIDANDPFSGDPHRHPALKVNNEKPFNAESPPSLLVESFLTPNPLFFIRNHLPVPKISLPDHVLQVEGLGILRPIVLSVDELKQKFQPVSVTSVIQCAGNRRASMNEYKKVQGLMWDGTAISNAKWTGVRLRDILILAGVDPNDARIRHVHFEGSDSDHTGKNLERFVRISLGQRYGASIPFDKAMSPEVIVAYKMNDEDIPLDHGYPLRLVAPGVVGARQVKWLAGIKTSDEESHSHWQRKDYKAFPPSVQFGDHLNWDQVPSIQEYPVQSAICVPERGAKFSRADSTIDLKGYAWSGGGRGIIRVEVSIDGGKTWHLAKMRQDPNQNIEKMWAWTLWQASLNIPDDVNEVELVCKATDRSYNTQPETPNGIWNVRGLINNAWHRVKVQIVD